MDRRLVAILAADVVGYSRLMETDEDGTLAKLKMRRRTILEPLVAQHGGRIVKLMGDGVLVEFASAVRAVSCAVDLQKQMAEANTDLADDQAIVLRVGVNLGDVIVEGNDLYGDGVNVAARLEAIAEPGGVCVSGSLHDQVKGKLKVAFEDLGRQKLKNIAEPIHVYRARLVQPSAPEECRRWESTLSLPAKPSIAVLPFDNLSGDPEQQYFSDGITEDIITELSRFHWLFVIARNSSFQYRGMAANVQQIGRELGVRYIVEGSVRRSGDRLRITAQLLDARTGVHLWADRYDRTAGDIFAVQDEVTQSIVSILPGRLEEAAAEHERRKPTEDLTAYDFLLRGEAHLRSGGFGDREAFELFQKALEIDPHCGRAHSRIAYMYAYNVFRWGAPTDEALAHARQHVERALALDDADAFAHATATWVYLVSGEHDLADIHSKRAIVLNPNDWFTVMGRGEVLNYLGDHTQGIEWVLKALRLDPHYPATRLEVLIDACYMAHQYERAIEAFKRWPNPPAHMWAEAAACYAQLGQMERAREARRRFEIARPADFEFARFAAAHIAMCKHQDDRDHWLDGYRKAGLSV
ncbi:MULTISPECIES: adenylate/guanylate cyclase domain-containing protein [unclassified Ensifer]|uniref:adenylate/guanylate cyclase domain-containing protein n=1 Tax=unclassified Ensifer TaxID=2633371 RepID=UPI00300FD2E7